MWDEKKERLIIEENIEDKSVRSTEMRSAFPYEYEDLKTKKHTSID